MFVWMDSFKIKNYKIRKQTFYEKSQGHRTNFIRLETTREEKEFSTLIFRKEKTFSWQINYKNMIENQIQDKATYIQFCTEALSVT